MKNRLLNIDLKHLNKRLNADRHCEKYMMQKQVIVNIWMNVQTFKLAFWLSRSGNTNNTNNFN